MWACLAEQLCKPAYSHEELEILFLKKPLTFKMENGKDLLFDSSFVSLKGTHEKVRTKTL